MGNHEFAKRDFTSAIEIEPGCTMAHFHRGTSKLRANQVREAIDDFRRSDELDQEMENPGIFDGLGQCHHAMRNFTEAIDEFKTAIDKEPKNVDFRVHRAKCYFDMQKFDLAADDLQVALDQNDADPQVLYRLGLTQYAAGKYKKAVKTLKLALANKPYITYEADIYYHMGLSYCRVEKFEKAIFPFSRCVERIPSDIRYVHERAKAYQMIEYHEEAVADFSTVIKKNPKNAHAYFRRAFSLKSLKRFAEAADDFEKAKELDPLNPKLVVNYKKLKGVGCIVLCEPGEEKLFA